MICAEPRSGSSLLAELLFNTGVAGAPTEYFDAGTMQRFQEVWRTPSFEQYVDALRRKKTSPNGVFGFKVHYEQYVDAFSARELSLLFPNLRFIRITRRDRLRAAVSFARALQTDQWASDHPARPDAPVFDREQIAECLARIHDSARGWDRFFAQKSIAPLHVVYEDFVA